MPLQHNIFLGGQPRPGVFNPDFQMYPQTPPSECDACEIACHKPNNVRFYNRVLNTCPTSPCDGDNCEDPALVQYLKQLQDDNDPLVLNQFLNVLILPKRHEYTRFWFEVVSPSPGLTFRVLIRDLALEILPNLDAGLTDPCVDEAAVVENHGLIDLQALNGGDPLYLNRNDMLQLEVTGLPAAGVPCTADNCFSVNVGVQAHEFCAGSG